MTKLSKKLDFLKRKRKLILLFVISFCLWGLNKAEALAENSTLSAITVSGTVTSADDNSPLIGVNVLVKGTSRGTVTDFGWEVYDRR